MRLHIISDLHLERSSFDLPATDADLIVIAGDVHTGLASFDWMRRSAGGRPVIFVAGNHEFYGQDLPCLFDRFLSVARGTNIHPLENESITIDGVTFLGSTLWTDMELFGNVTAAARAVENGMGDFT